MGSISMSTVSEVILSDGGVASMTPPVIQYKKMINTSVENISFLDIKKKTPIIFLMKVTEQN